MVFDEVSNTRLSINMRGSGCPRRQLQWAQEQSLDDLSEAPETDADEAEDASSPFSKDDYENGSNWPTNRS
jgi:hypothetical protein